mgnify:CR=1 FL=1
MIILVTMYTFLCFSIFGSQDPDRKRRFLLRQNILMFMLQLVAYLVMYLETEDVKLLVFYLMQVVLFAATILLYTNIYPNVSRLVINNMCMLLCIGMIMLTRLDYGIAIRQFIIASGAIALCLVIPVIIRKFKLLSEWKKIYALVGIVSLAAVIVVGRVSNGAMLGFEIAGINIQPSELVKIVFVFFVAASFKESLEFIREANLGFIVRTNAAQATVEDIKDEYCRLRQEYLKLRETAIHRTVLSCLKKQLPEYLHILRDMKKGQLDSIVTDDAEILGQIRQYLDQFPQQEYILKFYEDPMISLNKVYSLDTRLCEALRERVWLKSGGYLIIQPTEALTVIDVNSGKSVAKKKAQEHYFKINMEAAKEIACQMRLRNLSGIIIVDFIDMKSDEDNELLLKLLRTSVREDSVPVQIVDMTKLHLVEITRKKVKKSLAEQLMT